jgi:TRAP-type mannitol/chloroaromatic compound transport system permease small subunit
MRSLVDAINRLSEGIGRAVAWLTLIMVLVTVVVVVLRYLFDVGWIWMQESITWMHAAVFMLGAAYTLRRDEHVRVDIFYRQMSARRRALVGIAGTVLFLLPVCVFIGMSSWDYVTSSWVINEASREAGGLPYPFVPILKSLILITAVLVGLQACADLLRDLLIATGRRQPGPSATVPPGEVL